MKFFATLLLPMVAIFVFNSCTTSTGLVQQGDIIGRVYLSSANITPKNEASQSITVTLTGNTSYSSVSADSGKFVFDKVIQGIYTVTYSKVGYISNTVKNVQFVGNGILELSTVYLRQDESFGKIKSTVGFVRLFDENGDSLSDHSGAMVSIVGTSISAISDSSGAFYFPKYPVGLHDVSFSKNGFQTFVVPNVVFPDSNKITGMQQLIFQNRYLVALAQPPKFTVLFDSIVYNYNYGQGNGNGGRMYGNCYILHRQQDGSYDTTLSISPRGSILPSGYGKRLSIVTVLGTTPDVSIENYDPTITTLPDYPLENPGRTIYPNAGLAGFITPKNRWHVHQAGKEVYIRLYARWTTNDNILHYFENFNEKRIGMSGYNSKVLKVTFPNTFIPYQ